MPFNTCNRIVIDIIRLSMPAVIQCNLRESVINKRVKLQVGARPGPSELTTLVCALSTAAFSCFMTISGSPALKMAVPATITLLPIVARIRIRSAPDRSSHLRGHRHRWSSDRRHRQLRYLCRETESGVRQPWARSAR